MKKDPNDTRRVPAQRRPTEPPPIASPAPSAQIEEAMRFFDDSRFPLVVATAPTGEHAAVDIYEFYREWDAILERGEHTILIDLTSVNPLFIGARERKVIADEIERRRATLDRRVVAEARLCRNALVRGFMTALDWIVADLFAFPVAYFDNRAEAERWLDTRWRARGERDAAADTESRRATRGMSNR